MPEGLTAPEVGKEIGHHARHSTQEERDRILSIAEAVLLSLVALLAGWSGYAAAKWSTESRVALAEALTARSNANRSNLEALSLRNFDSSTFEAWFAAYTAGSEPAMALAERRFRPEFRIAFDAWRATNPESNPRAPAGPTYMPQYRQPELATAARLDREQTRRMPQAWSRANDRTTMSVRLSFSPPSSSSSGSARSSRFAASAMGWSRSAQCCSSSPSCSSRSSPDLPDEWAA